MFSKIINTLFPKKEVIDLKSIIAQGAMLVDVRNPDEYKSGHVKGSVNIPLDQISQRLDRFKNKNTIVVFCRSNLKNKPYEWVDINSPLFN